MATKQKTKKVIKLEDVKKLKPSIFILMAIDDINLVKDKGYRMNMNYWANLSDEQCSVCLGGAVLVGSFSTKLKNNDIKGALSIAETCDVFGIKGERNLAQEIASLFDNIRTKISHRTLNNMELIWPRINFTDIRDIIYRWVEDYPYPYHGYIYDNKLKTLKYELRILARRLAKAGF